MSNHLLVPHRGTLVNLLSSAERANEMKMESRDWPSWDLSPRQLSDLELLLNGGFSPLQGFLTRTDYENVCNNMRLEDGTLWPMPITLDVTEEFVKGLGSHHKIALRDPEGVMLAALNVEDVWKPEREAEAEMVFGTTSKAHPGVAYLLQQTNPCYVGGRLPAHYDFGSLRLTPAEIRAEFSRLGWRKVVAFQTYNPMHRAHQELTMNAANRVGANLLIHPSVGLTKPVDVEYYTRVRYYHNLLSKYPNNTVRLALLPLAMRMAGPRSALWHAIIHRNYGCTHFIVSRDHADPGADTSGQLVYRPHEAQELVKSHQPELGVTMVPSRVPVYLKDEDRYVPEDEVPHGARVLNLSASELRRQLAEGRELPAWFTFPEVAKELQGSYPPRHRQGFALFFTGLSGSGKSTIANVFRVKLLELGGRPVTLLDGDIVRKHLSSELGFSKEHRDLNIRRIGFVASEIAKNGGIAICAPIAPYDSIRKEVRTMIEPHGGFILVYLSTPLETCEARDRKGLYAKARAGLLQQFTGVNDPYEAPDDASVTIDTSKMTPEEAAQEILIYLERTGYIGANGAGLQSEARPQGSGFCHSEVPIEPSEMTSHKVFEPARSSR